MTVASSVKFPYYATWCGLLKDEQRKKQTMIRSLRCKLVDVVYTCIPHFSNITLNFHSPQNGGGIRGNEMKFNEISNENSKINLNILLFN